LNREDVIEDTADDKDDDDDDENFLRRHLRLFRFASFVARYLCSFHIFCLYYYMHGKETH
jgi:hypothetical protein